MDPFTVIVTALVAGAAAGGKDAASTAVKDAYVALRNRVRIRTNHDTDVESAIEANEVSPGSNTAGLEKVLRQHSLSDDSELKTTAALLISSVGCGTIEDAGNFINLNHAQGVQIGNHGTQHNNFS